MWTSVAFTISTIALTVLVGCGASGSETPSAARNAWEAANPIQPIPTPPQGIRGTLDQLPTPPTSASVRLGRWLFFDTRLSADNTVSCASCHQSGSAFSEKTALATGIDGQLGTRKTPPLLNLAFVARPAFFWDGRAASLEAQASGPILNPIEMGNTEANLLATLQNNASYPSYFDEAFGTSTITLALVTRAISDYERTRFSGASPLDRGQLSATARQGQRLFGQSRCTTCHGGERFTDDRFHNTGVAWEAATQTFRDSGRGGVTGRAVDLGAFKTPTLRDLTSRGPYMHDGSVATLSDVVEFYNGGGTANPHLDPAMRPLNLSSSEKAALVEFLESLDGTGYADTGPSAFPQ